MAIVAEVIQEMVDQDLKNIEDFDVAVARANFLLLQTVELRDVMEGLISDPCPKLVMYFQDEGQEHSRDTCLSKISKENGRWRLRSGRWLSNGECWLSIL